jgi:nicotinamidase-related amidase
MAEIEATLPNDLQTRWFNAPTYTPDDPWHGFDPTRAAVVLIDMINWQAHPDGTSIQSLRRGGQGMSADYLVERCETMVIPQTKRLLDAARTSGAKVVHVRLASRSADFTDVVPAFQAYLRGCDAVEGGWGTKVLDGLYDPADVSLIKTGSGGFTGSDLDRVLRNLGVDTVLYVGVVTTACVLLTVAHGFDLGYRQYLVTDCTAALSDEDQAAGELLMGRYMALPVLADDAVAHLA